MSSSTKDVLRLAGNKPTPQGHFDPALQPAIVTTPTKNVLIIIEPPTDIFTLNYLKVNNLYLLPDAVKLTYGKWKLFLNQFYTVRSEPPGQTFQLTHDYDVDEFLKRAGINKKTLMKAFSDKPQ